MYYFEKGRYGFPLFYKENGLPVFARPKRLSRRRFVLWMPTNWLFLALHLFLLPLTLWTLFKPSQQTTGKVRHANDT